MYSWQFLTTAPIVSGTGSTSSHFELGMFTTLTSTNATGNLFDTISQLDDTFISSNSSGATTYISEFNSESRIPGTSAGITAGFASISSAVISLDGVSWVTRLTTMSSQSGFPGDPTFGNSGTGSTTGPATTTWTQIGTLSTSSSEFYSSITTTTFAWGSSTYSSGTYANVTTTLSVSTFSTYTTSSTSTTIALDYSGNVQGVTNATGFIPGPGEVILFSTVGQTWPIEAAGLSTAIVSFSTTINSLSNAPVSLLTINPSYQSSSAHFSASTFVPTTLTANGTSSSSGAVTITLPFSAHQNATSSTEAITTQENYLTTTTFASTIPGSTTVGGGFPPFSRALTTLSAFYSYMTTVSSIFSLVSYDGLENKIYSTALGSGFAQSVSTSQSSLTFPPTNSSSGSTLSTFSAAGFTTSGSTSTSGITQFNDVFSSYGQAELVTITNNPVGYTRIPETGFRVNPESALQSAMTLAGNPTFDLSSFGLSYRGIPFSQQTVPVLYPITTTFITGSTAYAVSWSQDSVSVTETDSSTALSGAQTITTITTFSSVLTWQGMGAQPDSVLSERGGDILRFGGGSYYAPIDSDHPTAILGPGAYRNSSSFGTNALVVPEFSSLTLSDDILGTQAMASTAPLAFTFPFLVDDRNASNFV